jgi:hypothetical protein
MKDLLKKAKKFTLLTKGRLLDPHIYCNRKGKFSSGIPDKPFEDLIKACDLIDSMTDFIETYIEGNRPITMEEAREKALWSINKTKIEKENEDLKKENKILLSSVKSSIDAQETFYKITNTLKE